MPHSWWNASYRLRNSESVYIIAGFMRASSYTLFGGAVFLGAFLLFAIQLIAGKQLLPFFGGSSSVWATSLMFFTAMLFAGYLYVYLLAMLSRRVQVTIHLCLVGSALLLALGPFSASYTTHILSGLPTGDAPALGVLATLLLAIGAPFFLLSTTGPLMQYWWGTASKREPYSLYALSNAASLAALISYPFVIEPLLSLRHQNAAWTLLFLGYAVACVASAVRFFRVRDVSEERARRAKVSFPEGLVWIALAALPSFTLVAVTTQITQQIAPVPLLWIVPLVLYLLTFVVAFAERGQSIFVPFFFFGSVCVAWWFAPAVYDAIVFQVLSYLVLLFFCGLSCHALLYRARPGTESLPLFYVFLSFGGALGTLLASVVAPLVFSDYFEFPLALALSGALAAWILPNAFFPRILDVPKIILAKILFIALAAVLFVFLILPDDEWLSISTRNFYGNAKVIFGDGLVSLRHGTTIHGMQFADAEDARLPTTYYTPGSGIGRAILYEQNVREGEEMRVGVIGLGTGTAAAYCRAGDTYVFYEIDRRIEEIARSYFSYLSHCDGAEVRIGDGRIVLESERAAGDPGAYDVLAMDAFSDDTIPVHLLTLQALETYASHLRAPESIIAINISNRYLDLSPVVFRLAAELGFSVMLVSDSGDSSVGGSASAWVVLSKDAATFASTAFANTYSRLPEVSDEVWTDDYSSLLPVLDLSWPWE